MRPPGPGRTWSERYGDWVDRSDLTARDLGLFRVLYASVTIVFLPSHLWISRFDPAFFRPAPGPFSALSSFPPTWFLAGLDLLTAAAVALLLVGYRTRPVSLALAALLLVGTGLEYSFGKIDHSILFVLTPLFLGLAGWGNALSLDARRRPGGPDPVVHWALRAFAVAIGVAFLTAGTAKLLGGWLNPSTQATYGYVVVLADRGYTDWLVRPAAALPFAPAWELVDWATVLLEGGLIVCALTWRSWRLGLCSAVLLHVGVLLTLNINFWWNVLAYGAFVQWGLLLPRLPGWSAGAKRLGRLTPLSLVAGAGALAAAFFVIVHATGPLTSALGWLVLLLGLLVAGGYLIAQLGSLRPPRTGERPGRRARSCRSLAEGEAAGRLPVNAAYGSEVITKCDVPAGCGDRPRERAMVCVAPIARSAGPGTAGREDGAAW